jgi:hypothetical protein
MNAAAGFRKIPEILLKMLFRKIFNISSNPVFNHGYYLIGIFNRPLMVKMRDI